MYVTELMNDQDFIIKTLEYSRSYCLFPGNMENYFFYVYIFM